MRLRLLPRRTWSGCRAAVTHIAESSERRERRGSPRGKQKKEINRQKATPRIVSFASLASPQELTPSLPLSMYYSLDLCRWWTLEGDELKQKIVVLLQLSTCGSSARFVCRLPALFHSSSQAILYARSCHRRVLVVSCRQRIVVRSFP